MVGKKAESGGSAAELAKVRDVGKAGAAAIVNEKHDIEN